jgi:hypothetical protein
MPCALSTATRAGGSRCVCVCVLWGLALICLFVCGAGWVGVLVCCWLSLARPVFSVSLATLALEECLQGAHNTVACREARATLIDLNLAQPKPFPAASAPRSGAAVPAPTAGPPTPTTTTTTTTTAAAAAARPSSSSARRRRRQRRGGGAAPTASSRTAPTSGDALWHHIMGRGDFISCGHNHWGLGI